MPGIMVDRKAAPTDNPPVIEKIIIGILGGINSASTDEQATNAVACPSGYPSSFIRGIIICPIAAMAAEELPEIAPNSAQVKTVTAPKPPLRRPTIELTKSSKRFEIPPSAIKIPAKINKGKANRAKPPLVLKP